ncbi:MAG: hypothetical protein AAB416_01455 [Patescibacteria group bacterium]
MRSQSMGSSQGFFSSGGTVRFESAENKGTTIFVTLPLGGCTAIQGEKSLA